jgi:ABC-type transport system involved in multi-copper enzyme maturation permease subunit
MFRVFRNEMYKIFHSKKLYVFGVLAFAIAGLMVVAPTEATMAQDLMVNEISRTFLPMLFAIIISDSITEEYKSGTLKLSMIHPIKRSSYLLGKVIALIPVGIIFIAWCQILGIGIELIKFGELKMSGSIMFELFTQTVGGMLPMLGFSMIVLLMAVFFRGTGAVIGATVGLLIFFQILSPIAYKYHFENLLINTHNNMFIESADFTTSMMVCIGYIVVFLGASLVAFNRKDITE